jgi:hypothetical protein
MNDEKLSLGNEFLEMQIINAVRDVLVGKVNELLSELQFFIPHIQFGDNSGVYDDIVPVISLSSCESTEKERIIKLDTYSLTITITIPETNYSELYCCAYSAAVRKALEHDVTLGGVVDKAVITGKKYVTPKKANCGQSWELIIILRLTIEGMKNDG